MKMLQLQTRVLAHCLITQHGAYDWHSSGTTPEDTELNIKLKLNQLYQRENKDASIHRVNNR